ncbi:DUF6489 family protein [Qipengyuania sp. JC766]|uniref:DUF6489 family protein n=1 Tax=Qipengyuania sp. JC766 TaxID=3232139 RepID=UPI00345B0B13
MKVQVEIDCTPEEARAFMGLPDVGKANDVYMDAVTNAMKGAANPEQMQQFARQLAPMGQVGFKLFQTFLDAATGPATGDKPARSKD